MSSTTYDRPLRILLTGGAGQVGNRALAFLVNAGHAVTATDLVPEDKLHRPATADGATGSWTYKQADLTSLPAIDDLFASPFDAVVHIGAIPRPRAGLDDRVLHHNNVTGSYNVLRTAVDRGIKRIVQASSVNAHGLSYSKIEHVSFRKLPIDENVEMKDEDAYALSKHICEVQADSLVRLEPDVRIASLRLHMVCTDYAEAFPEAKTVDICSWVSYEAVSRACLLAITSEGWAGHEVFNVIAPEICWEGTLEEQQRTGVAREGGDKVPTLALVERYCAYTPEIDAAYFAENPRRAAWTTAKAEALLGWKHDV